MIQGTDGVTQTVNHFLQGSKDFVAEATLPNFLPNLFYGIHFRCVRWDVKQNNIVRRLQTGGFMPCRTITAKQNNIISIFFRQLLQEDIHADSIAIGQDEKVPIACQRLHRAISIAVLTDMMARHAGTDTVPAPAVFRLVDPTKSGEPLNKSPTADDGSFPPILRFEKWEIHKVFRHFPNLVLTKNLSPSTADLNRASQDIFSQEYRCVSRKNGAAQRKKDRCPGALAGGGIHPRDCWTGGSRSGAGHCRAP